MSRFDDTRCNIDKCLRKYKGGDGNISAWCGVVGKEALASIKPCSKDCPLYCDKFFCFQTRKIVKNHENTYWISNELMDDNYRDLYEINALDVKFSGLSKDGNADLDKQREFEDKHHGTQNIVCPYCDYEIDDVWDYITNEYSDNVDAQCPECDREFQATIHREITFSTSRMED